MGGISILPLVDSLYSQLDFANKGYLESRKRLALDTLLTNLIIGYCINKPVAISKKWKDYSFEKKFYGIEHYSYSFLIPLLTALKENGFLEEVSGFFNFETMRGYRTRIWGNLKLWEMVLSKLTPQKLQYSTCIILKDSDKHLIEYKPNKIVRNWQRFLEEYNELIASFEVAIPLLRSTSKKTTLFKTPPFNYSNHITIYDIITTETDTGGNNISTPLREDSWLNRKLDCRLYRVFNNSKFNLGGRFYGADHQRLNQSDRSLIKINGNKTSEIDFRGLHLNMLYNFEGIDFEKDPYSINNLNPELRPLIKLVSLIGINALTPKSGIDAFNFEMFKDYELYQIQKKYNLKTRELFAQFENTHPQISKYFRSGYGIKLQFIDSLIAEEILKHFTRQGKPCLCIHDSFIVEENNREELAEVMRNSYKKHLGFPGKVEIKF